VSDLYGLFWILIRFSVVDKVHLESIILGPYDYLTPFSLRHLFCDVHVDHPIDVVMENYQFMVIWVIR
jgi:hypothetical protein